MRAIFPAFRCNFFSLLLLPWLTSFSPSHFPACIEALLHPSADWEMRICLLPRNDREIVSNSSSNILKNITGWSSGKILVEAHIPPIVFSGSILYCFLGVVIFPRLEKNMFCFLCFISTEKLETNHDNSICIRNTGEAQGQLTHIGRKAAMWIRSRQDKNTNQKIQKHG